MIRVSMGCMGSEELAAIQQVFDYGYFGLGTQVLQFEEALQRYLGAPHVIAVNTGTAALHLALDALGIGAGDEVIAPSLTFAACFQAIKMTGATPVSCDVEPDTLLLDIADMERRITPRTRALMPIHYAGSPCDMDAILSLAKRRGLRVVEDAAHAFGSTLQGRRIGSFGDVTTFSFDSIKNLTCGEGGAIVCHDADLADLIRTKRMLGTNRKPIAGADLQDSRWRYQVTTLGFRYHMGNINAAAGMAQLAKVDGFIARRRAICRRYDEALQSLPDIRPLRIDYDETAPHIYVIRVGGGRRDALARALRAADVETSLNYVPNHLQPYFQSDGASLPETERAFAEMLTLPLHCGLSDDDVATVINGIRAFCGAHAEAAS
ncbi:MAG: DegT/DnrJ/EryC1/StrS family aminotransferase [Gemmatimonadaceae bacterium]